MMKDMLRNKLSELQRAGSEMLENAIDQNINRIKDDIDSKVQNMMAGGSVQAAQEQLQRTEVNEGEYLRFIADNRKLTPLTILTFGLFLLAILPGWLKIFPGIAFFFAFVSLYTSYISECKVNVEEGFDGVITHWGEPTGKLQKPGRTWYWIFNKFCTFQVSTRDLFTNIQVTNYTQDFGQMILTLQVTFEIFDQKLFLKTTTPAGTIKLMKLYANYIGLRLITSMTARSKFIGTKDMKNFKSALDRYMNRFGIRVKYVQLPSVQNEVLNELEYVQTRLRKIKELDVSKQAERENAIKTIETEIRSNTKATRRSSNELAQKKIELETILASELNSAKQTLVVNARTQLVKAHSALMRDIQTFLAKVQKAQALRSLVEGLEVKFNLSLAKAKRIAYEAMVPKKVNVIGVSGMEAGFLLSAAADILKGSQKQLPMGAVRSPHSEEEEVTD